MTGNGWRGRGDPMEESVERWLLANNIQFRRGDDMKTRLDFFLPDFNVYIECKRFHTPRINDQMERAPDIIVIQGTASLRFLDSLISRAVATQAANEPTPQPSAGV
jgi:hypothetical protein